MGMDEDHMVVDVRRMVNSPQGWRLIEDRGLETSTRLGTLIAAEQT